MKWIEEVRFACSENDLDTVHSLLEIHKPAREWRMSDWKAAMDLKGKSLLHYCAVSGKAEVAQYLITHMPHFNIANTTNNVGQSPLHVAACEGSSDLCVSLLRNGANIHGVDDAGYTPLHCAARWGNEDAIQSFLSFGADFMRKTTGGETVADVALAYNHSNLMGIILAKPLSPTRPMAVWKAKSRLLVVQWEPHAVARGTKIECYHVQMKDHDAECEDPAWEDVPGRPFSRSKFCALHFERKRAERITRSFRFRVRARNAAGKWSQWSESSPAVRTLDFEVHFILPKNKLSVMEDFPFSLRLEGRPLLPSAWIGLFHAHEPMDSNKTTRRFSVSDIQRPCPGGFKWKGSKGFPSDGSYDFRLFEDSCDESMPVGRSAPVAVHTNTNMHVPTSFIAKAFENRKISGVPISCEGGEVVYCSPWLLACRSKVLYRMLYDVPTDATRGFVPRIRPFQKRGARKQRGLPIPHISAPAFKMLVRWLYTNETSEIEMLCDGEKDATLSDENVKESEDRRWAEIRTVAHLICAADAFDLPVLFAVMLVRFRSKRVCPDTALQTFLLAHTYQAYEALRVTSSVLRERSEDIARSQTFCELDDSVALDRIEAAFDAPQRVSYRGIVECEEGLASAVWTYRDALSTEFGPFSGAQMRTWYENGLFPEDLRVKHVSWKHFRSLKNLGAEPFRRAEAYSSGTRAKVDFETQKGGPFDHPFEILGRSDGSTEGDLLLACHATFIPDFFFYDRDGSKHFTSRGFLALRSNGLRYAVDRVAAQGDEGIDLHISSNAVSTFVRFLYTGEVGHESSVGGSRDPDTDTIRIMSQVESIELLPHALNFGLPNLAKRCWGCLSVGISRENAAAALVAAMSGDASPALQYPKLRRLLLRAISSKNIHEVVQAIEDNRLVRLDRSDDATGFTGELARLCKHILREEEAARNPQTSLIRVDRRSKSSMTTSPLDRIIKVLFAKLRGESSILAMNEIEDLLSVVHRAKQRDESKKGKTDDGMYQLVRALPLLQDLAEKRSGVSLPVGPSASERGLLVTLSTLIRQSPDESLRNAFVDALDVALAESVLAPEPKALALFCFLVSDEGAEAPKKGALPAWIGSEDLAYIVEVVVSFVLRHPQLRASKTWKILTPAQRKRIVLGKVRGLMGL